MVIRMYYALTGLSSISKHLTFGPWSFYINDNTSDLDQSKQIWSLIFYQSLHILLIFYILTSMKTHIQKYPTFSLISTHMGSPYQCSPTHIGSPFHWDSFSFLGLYPPLTSMEHGPSYFLYPHDIVLIASVMPGYKKIILVYLFFLDLWGRNYSYFSS